MRIGPIPLHSFFSIALELVELVSQHHRNGILYEPLSPDHLFIHYQGERPMLRLVSSPSCNQTEKEGNDNEQEELNRAFAYISPEQTGRMKRKIDERSNLYTLGILFYELLVEETPLKAKSVNEWIHAHMALLPIPPHSLKSEVPRMLSDLVMKLLSKAADDRYFSVYGLRYDLQKCANQYRESGSIAPFALGVIDERSRFQLPTQLYGREEDLQGLLQSYERVSAGSMEFLLIGGHAGSGKTSLVKAIQTPIMQNKGHFISGKFDQLNHSLPYSSLIVAFRDLIGQIIAESEERFSLWKTKILTALGQSGSVLIEVISELALIIGEQPPVEDLPPAESTIRFQTLFCNFIQLFADQHHPLVIWLDNLQWAYAASLHLLRVLLNDPTNKHLLIIGTYRNNEIHEGHPVLEILFGQSPKKDPSIHCMNLKSLGYSSVIDYVADTLHTDPVRVKPLAEALYQKTGGNPFYIKQMLHRGYEDKLLYFNADQACWDWDIELIKERKGFEDVISLIMSRFNALPPDTRKLLHLASCIGNAFDIKRLSMLCEQEVEETEQVLQAALSEGFVWCEGDRYIFLHDQLRSAAYELMLEEEKKQVHLKIGHFMLSCFQLEAIAMDDLLFEMVHHLNRGSELITEPSEIELLASLNLQAGKRAKASAAYEQALELLEIGVQLIGSKGWSTHFDLYSNLLLESSECQYFCGYFDQAECRLEQLLIHVVNLADRAKIYIIQITMYAFLKRERKSAEIALRAMAEFGLVVPSKASKLAIISEIALTQLSLAREGDNIKQLSKSKDPLHKALADIVMASSPILFITNEQLAVILFAKYVRMALDQRNSEALAIALGSYAITLCFGLKSFKASLRLVEIALRYSEKMDSVVLKGKIHFMVGMILQFLRPQLSDRHFEHAAQFSLEVGDLNYAGYAISSRIITDTGNLRRLSRMCKQYELTANRMLDAMSVRVIDLTNQYVRLLQSVTDAPNVKIQFEYFDNSRLLQETEMNNAYKSYIVYNATCKLEVYYLYGYYAEALAAAEETREYEGSKTLSFDQRNCFYHALTLTALYPNASDALRRSYRKRLNRYLAQMKKWTRIAPENTLSKYWIILAESARLNGKHTKAAKLYDQAIELAHVTGCSQDEAIALDLAGQFHLSLNHPHTAETYLRNACKAYCKWGARGKVAFMQERYPALKSLTFFEEEDSEDCDHIAELGKTEPDSKLAQGLDKVMDMDTIRQASRIVSKGAAETKLLEGFLRLAIHNAGAEKGIILLGGLGKQDIVAESDMNRCGDRCTEPAASYSAAVVQYVMRTKESIVLADACQSIFASDPYIHRKRPKSILCMPIRYPDHREGILYLENNLMADVFTIERFEVLEMAFSQMAYMQLWQLREPAGEATKAVEVKLAASLIESLSIRELDVLRLMADGLSNKEIAAGLAITEGTVKIHAFNIYGKLQVNRRVQAISKARELQLLG